MFHPRQQFLKAIFQSKQSLQTSFVFNTHVKVAVRSKLWAPDVGHDSVTSAASSPHSRVVHLLRMLGTGGATLEHHAISKQEAEAELLSPGPGERPS